MVEIARLRYRRRAEGRKSGDQAAGQNQHGAVFGRVGHGIAPFLAATAALLPLFAKLGKDFAYAVVIGLIGRLGCGQVLGEIAGCPYLADEPFAPSAHREMQAHLKRLPRTQLPIDQGAGALCNFLAA
nr:hypothetical protein [Pontibaca salina]